MIKRILLCAGLAAAMLFSGCNMINDGVSDIGSGVSDLTSDISSGLSDAESDLSSDWSDIRDDVSDDIRDDVSDDIRDDTDREESRQESSDEMRDDDRSSESAPTSGAPSDTSEPDLSEPAAQTELSVPAYDLSALDNTKQGWGQGVRLDDRNRPEASLLFQEKYGKYDALFIGEEEPTIYLTFDCGYENGCTTPILDTLKEKDVQAVFFVISDYVERQPELVQRMIDDGHVIGNHSDTHPCMPEQSTERCEQEILNLHKTMEEQFQYTMTLFRPPAGEFSERTLAITQQLGYTSVFWSYAYADWDPNNQMGPDKALPKITKALHPGAIYLLHAVSPDNAAILGGFIDCAREQGYTFALLG